jgi:hypothetical protein
MEIKKIEDQDLKVISGQCCCNEDGEVTIYDKGSCCLDDCHIEGELAYYISPYH